MTREKSESEKVDSLFREARSIAETNAMPALVSRIDALQKASSKNQ